MSFTPAIPHLAPILRPHMRQTPTVSFGIGKEKPQAQPPNTEEILRKAIPVTVALKVVGPRMPYFLGKTIEVLRKMALIKSHIIGRGLGFWLQTKQGLVVITNAHVVDPLSNWASSNAQASNAPQSILARCLNVISTQDDVRQTLKPATLKMALAERPNDPSRQAIDYDLDIAVLKPDPLEDPEKYSHIQLLEPDFDIDSVEVGEPVLGVIQDEKCRSIPTILTGIISGFLPGKPLSKRATKKEPFVDVCTTLATKKGNSGSPLLRLRNGNAIGIIHSGNRNSRTWATSMADVMRKLTEWGF